MNKCSFLLLWLLSLPLVNAQLQSPEKFLGYSLGEKFTWHHQVVDYFQHLEAQSPSLQLSPYGSTYEGRLLQLAFISSPENLKNLESIRKRHLNNSGSLEGVKNTDKVIVWLSYNVHGNEASSTEAAMQTAYALLTQHKEWLEDTVVILDPCINPDGRDRYVNFYKQTQSAPYDSKKYAREHIEGWHNGRSNHYMFDLNRDWAWLSQVESQQRIKRYNQWLPHIHVDFHEQGINSPYYFAPAAEPLHEIITDFQRTFQDQLGKNHAKYFDKEGWFYYTKQVYDLLYPSYGDTYPTYLGAIGMTYEQAGGGIAGLGIDNDENIELTLKDRIAHHYTTGISTVELATQNRATLNENYQDFFSPKNAKYRSFVMEGSKDKLHALADFLNQHEIKSGFLNTETTVKGFDYESQRDTSAKFKSGALVVSTQQPKGKMVQVLLEPFTQLSDSLTYDITAWSLPYAYGLKTMASQQALAHTVYTPQQATKAVPKTTAYGYAIHYESFKDAQFLAALLKAGMGVRQNRVALTNSGVYWKPGSVFILRGDQQKNEDYTQTLVEIAEDFKRTLHPISTGYSSQGPDLGAAALQLIKAPKIAVLKSEEANTLSYGEIWHYFEQQLGYPLLQIDPDHLEAALEEIDQLILPDGYYYAWAVNDWGTQVLDWVRKGGKLIAIAGAIDQFLEDETFSLQSKEVAEIDMSRIPYGEMERNALSSITTGSIFPVKLDPTHPLCFGLERYYTLKLNAHAYAFLDEGENAAYIGEDTTPINGFMGHNVLENQKESLVFGTESIGAGRVIYLVDNVLFRGFWYTGKVLFANALFY